MTTGKASLQDRGVPLLCSQVHAELSYIGRHKELEMAPAAVCRALVTLEVEQSTPSERIKRLMHSLGHDSGVHAADEDTADDWWYSLSPCHKDTTTGRWSEWRLRRHALMYDRPVSERFMEQLGSLIRSGLCLPQKCNALWQSCPGSQWEAGP